MRLRLLLGDRALIDIRILEGYIVSHQSQSHDDDEIRDTALNVTSIERSYNEARTFGFIAEE